jgi:hypothetical protein
MQIKKITLESIANYEDRRITKGQIAEQVYGGLTYDCSLPQPWVNEHEIGEEGILGIVWLYDESAGGSGRPAPITLEGLRALSTISMRRFNLPNPSDMSYRELQEVYNRVGTMASEKIKGVLSELANQVFSENLQVDSFAWVQYTPYFNDGDACTFGVNSDEDSIEINEESAYDDDDDGKKFLDVREKISQVLETIDEDHLLQAYGDHVRVIARRDRTEDVFDVEDYDHD